MVNPGNVHGFWQMKFKSAPNKNSLPTAPMLDLSLGAGHLTGHQCFAVGSLYHHKPLHIVHDYLSSFKLRDDSAFQIAKVWRGLTEKGLIHVRGI